MKNQLIKRIHEEHAEFLRELKKQPVDKIIDRAYEICYREELISMLECMYFDEEQMDKLLRLPNPVGFLYVEWLKVDASVCGYLEDLICDYVCGGANDE